MWNDADAPLAYLITFRTYGTWHHGDERLFSVDRHNNAYGSPKIEPIEHWREISAAQMKHAPVKLDTIRRTIVEKAIRETCEKRNWALYAVNVRTNHVHCVVAIGAKHPSAALNAFKANATRCMREGRCWPHEHSPWADKGSERYLWNEKSIAESVEYVVNGQGGELPKLG